MRLARALTLSACLLASPVLAQEAETLQPMTPERLAATLLAIDPDARLDGAGIVITLQDVPVTVVMDAGANRMRAMVPVASAAGLTRTDLERLMQANFDTALDARYAVAQGRLWSVYVHPLAELQPDQLLSAIAQVVTLAQTYGTFYSSGVQRFGGGDSGGLYLDLLEELEGQTDL